MPRLEGGGAYALPTSKIIASPGGRFEQAPPSCGVASHRLTPLKPAASSQAPKPWISFSLLYNMPEIVSKERRWYFSAYTRG